ncbi:MAG: hypothetical protein JXQ84_04035 [Rhodospirillaceae bacterium]|nr:hypothetical protein [Rhodospirillaceae bacterium]
MTSVLILADDLTGAVDSAVAFRLHGLRTVVAVTPDAVPIALRSQADVIAVNTSSRDVAPALATSIVARILAHPGLLPNIVFKKIDSRLKGNIAAEIKGVIATTPYKDMFVCPAIPRLGRLVMDAHVVGAGVDTPISIATNLASVPLPMVCPEVTTQQDIERTLPSDVSHTLLVGAAGLAEALAHRLRPTQPHTDRPRLPRPMVLAIGSRDPITVAQIQEIAHSCAVVAAPDGDVPALPPLGTDAVQVIQMVPGEGALSAQAAGTRFVKSIAAHLQSGPVRTVFACGGETADGLLRQMNVTVLEVVGEFAPGIPVSRCLGMSSDMILVTKSGGFGSPRTLVDLIMAVAE